MTIDPATRILVRLRDGTGLILRPMTPDVYLRIKSENAERLAALMTGNIGGIHLSMLGEAFRRVELTDEWINRASGEILVFTLTTATAVAIVDADDRPLSDPTPQSVAAILQDPSNAYALKIAFGRQAQLWQGEQNHV